MRHRARTGWPALPALAALALALALPLLAGCARQVAVTSPTPDAATAAVCARLLAELPVTLAGLDAREVTPQTRTTAAWGDPPIVLRCGVPAPAARTPTSVLASVDDVDWFAEELTAGALFTTDGRAVNVEVAVPDAYEPATVLGELGPAITTADPVAPGG